MGTGVAPSDLREGPDYAGRSDPGAEARSEAARALPDPLPAPRLYADQGGLQGESGHARCRWAGNRQALCAWGDLAQRQEQAALVRAHRPHPVKHRIAAKYTKAA